MRPRAIRKWTAGVALATLLVAYSPLGWSPPPLTGGGLVPDARTFDFGDVELNRLAQITITYMVDPQVVAVGPFFVANPPYDFSSNPGAAFSVDPSRTTCVAGASITKTSGCAVSVAFAPTSAGAHQAGFALSACIGTPSPCLPFSGLSSTLAFVGAGLAPPIPSSSPGGLLASASAVVLFAFLVLRGRRRR